MLFALLRARFRALLLTIALTLAAPRLATWLRSVGERQRRRGRSSLAWRAPLGAARALEQAVGRRQRRRATPLAAIRRTSRRTLRHR